jgi:hypothetical protein
MAARRNASIGPHAMDDQQAIAHHMACDLHHAARFVRRTGGNFSGVRVCGNGREAFDIRNVLSGEL